MYVLLFSVVVDFSSLLVRWVVNSRGKNIPLRCLDANQIHQKVQLLFDTPGAKIAPPKGPAKTVIGSSEAERGGFGAACISRRRIGIGGCVCSSREDMRFGKRGVKNGRAEEQAIYKCPYV